MKWRDTGHLLVSVCLQTPVEVVVCHHLPQSVTAGGRLQVSLSLSPLSVSVPRPLCLRRVATVTQTFSCDTKPPERFTSFT